MPKKSSKVEQASLNAPEQESEFVAPPELPERNSSSSADEFEPPTLEQSPTELNQVANLREAKTQIEKMLAKAASSSFLTMAAAQRSDSPGVLGVGLSSSLPGMESLILYVENNASEEQVRRELFDTMSVQAASDDNFPVEIVVTGPIEAYTNNKSPFRPAPAGVSIGHPRITAGTLGGWAKGKGERANRLLMVSNNHVIANSNDAQFGDAILQPGVTDRGQNPADKIAILERFVTIDFSGRPNFVDCATGWCWPDLTRQDYVYHGNSPTAKFFRVGANMVSPSINMTVGKSGRTTDLTKGDIQAVGVSINVSFGGRTAHFQDQFSVKGVAGNFSAGGDSGSFVWKWESGLPVVGLLFAGGGGITFCNPIHRVVDALDITLI